MHLKVGQAQTTYINLPYSKDSRDVQNHSASLTSCKTDNAGDGSLAAPFQRSNPRRKNQGVSACSFQELKLGGGTTSWNHWKPTKSVVQWQVCHLIVVWSNVISDLIVFDIQISAFATHSAARIPSICIWHSKGSCTLRLGLSPSHNYPVQVKCKASWSRIESDLHGGQHFVLLSTLSFSWFWLPRPGC